jgi:hypothetical protein
MTKVAPAPTQATLLAAELAATALQVAQSDILHHIYSGKYAPNSFNPGVGSGRFHPFRDQEGNWVPIFYAATTEEGSYCETLFRALGNGARSCRRVPGKRLAIYSYAQIRCCLPLQLAHLTGNQLIRLGITRSALLEPGALHYAQTAAWAAAIHAAYPQLQGLAWVSRQHDASTCIMLFGDRVAAEQLQAVSAPLDLGSQAGRLRADAVGQRLAVVITR